jgi:copper chaperone NosL
MLTKFYEFLSQPMIPWTRIALAVLVIPLGLAFAAPLWRISMIAPQYPQGLSMDVYAYKIAGGNDGQDIHEINVLNHYIGMHKLDATASADLDWIPFALGGMALLALRVSALGTVRDLIDMLVVTSYVSLFAFGRFVYRLWVFGHDLDPQAPVKVKPFMPVIIGHRTVANFETFSYPQLGSFLLALFAVGVVALTIWHLVVGRQRAKASMKTAVLAAPARS